MGIITLPNFRTTADVTAMVRLKDGGLAIDWSEAAGIKAWLYSDAQKAISGRFDVSVNQEDHTLLKCDYSATKPQYLGVNRIIVQATFRGRTKTYDKAAFNFVPRTSDVPGDITIEDPVVDLEIEVSDVSSSILDEVIYAAIAATEKANEAAEQIPLQVLTEAREATAEALVAAEEARAAGIDDVEADADNNVGTPSVDATLENKKLTLHFHNIKGLTGNTPHITIGTISTLPEGSLATVTLRGTADDPIMDIGIPVGATGAQGNTGSSVDYPFELVNNLTTDDATKALSSAQGVVIDGKISQLRQDVIGVLRDEKSSVSNWTNYFSISAKAGIKYSFLLKCDAASSNKNVGIGTSVSDTSYASVTMPTGGKGARVEYTPSADTVLYFNTYGSMTNVKVEVSVDGENIHTAYEALYPSYVTPQETFSWQKLNLVNGVFDSTPTITPTSTRLCFPVVLTIEDFIEAKVGNNSYDLSVKIFDANGQPMSAYNLGWVKQYSLDKDAVWAGARFVAVNFRRADDATITPEEGNLLLHIRDGFSFNELYKEIKAIPGGVSFTSQGGINANNTLSQFEVLANIVCVISGVNYIIPRGTTVEYQYLLDTLCFLIFDKDNLTLAIKKRADVSAEDIIFSNIVTPAGENRVISLPSCPVDWFIDGVSPYNKASESPGVPYYGESIKLNFFRLGDPKNYALTWMQSMVIDGDNILVFDNLNNDARARLIDAASGNIKMEESIPHGLYPAPHCNTACLGGQKYGANSVMPLVYLSMWGTGANRVCFVYDVVNTNDIYSISLVQVLDFSGIPSSLIGEGNCDFAVDSLNGFIYSIAYKTSNATDATNNATMICKFALPSAGNSTVSFTETDILDHFELPYVFMRQDLFVNNGNIYLASGGNDDDDARAKRIISVISPERKTIVSRLYLSDVGFIGEPEGFDVYKNKMYISDTSGSMSFIYL